MLLSNFKKNFLIVDSSYLIYAMSHRTLNIFKYTNDVPTNKEELYKIDFSKNEDFIHIFKVQFKSVIKKFCSEYLINQKNIVFALDCPKREIWRTEIFSDYKLHRMVYKEEGLNTRGLFKFAVNNLIPELEQLGFGFSILNDYSEADDIIAIVKKTIRQLYPKTNIVILASDSDFLQLIDKNCIIINTQKTILNNKTIGSPKKDLLLKILIGDTSDNIPKTFNKTKGDSILSRGFGIKAALKLINTPSLLLEYFKKYPLSKKQFFLNKKIIDFNNIPNEIQESIKEKFIKGV